jgi:Flp pilus assembly pilin Flp
MGRAIAAMGRLVRQEKGQDLIEYGLLMMLIAVGAMVAVGTLGDTIHNLFWVPIANAF